MPRCDEVLTSLLLSYPSPMSLTEISAELGLDNDEVSAYLKILRRCGHCSKNGSRWVISKNSFERAQQYIEKLMLAEDSLHGKWKEAIELRHYDRSLSIANREILAGKPDGFPDKAVSLLWLDHRDEAMIFAEHSLAEAEMHPAGWMAAAATARRMNYPECAEQFAKIALVSQMRMEANA